MRVLENMLNFCTNHQKTRVSLDYDNGRSLLANQDKQKEAKYSQLSGLLFAFVCTTKTKPLTIGIYTYLSRKKPGKISNSFDDVSLPDTSDNQEINLLENILLHRA